MMLYEGFRGLGPQYEPAAEVYLGLTPACFDGIYHELERRLHPRNGTPWRRVTADGAQPGGYWLLSPFGIRIWYNHAQEPEVIVFGNVCFTIREHALGERPTDIQLPAPDRLKEREV